MPPMRHNKWIIALAGVPAALAFLTTGTTPPTPLPAPSAVEAAATSEGAPVTGPVLSSPEPAETPAPPLSAAERARMAAELQRLKTRDAKQLVEVVSQAAEEAGSVVPPSFLLAIAHTETHGDVLAVSPAGAAGLAQATPAAFMMEGVEGPLFITNDYLMGTRAYIMKKPLGDALNITERVLDGEATLPQALELLETARALRRVGVEELEALAPRAPELFMQRVRAADARNEQALDELGRLLSEGAPRQALDGFREGLQSDFDAAMDEQQVRWMRYAEALKAERDRVLRAHFGQDPAKVMAQRRYEAGEVLGAKLDARFSPTKMALFLTRHLETKRQQALEAGIGADELEVWTAALYNGGRVNVLRLRSGLIRSIRETRDYMKKVPEMRQRLERVAGATG